MTLPYSTVLYVLCVALCYTTWEYIAKTHAYISHMCDQLYRTSIYMATCCAGGRLCVCTNVSARIQDPCGCCRCCWLGCCWCCCGCCCHRRAATKALCSCHDITLMLHTAHVCISMLVHAGTELFSRSTDLVQKITRSKQTHTHTPARARVHAL